MPCFKGEKLEQFFLIKIVVIGSLPPSEKSISILETSWMLRSTTNDICILISYKAII